MERQHDVCGCAGPGVPSKESALYQLKHLIDMLERREAEKRDKLDTVLFIRRAAGRDVRRQAAFEVTQQGMDALSFGGINVRDVNHQRRRLCHRHRWRKGGVLAVGEEMMSTLMTFLVFIPMLFYAVIFWIKAGRWVYHHGRETRDKAIRLRKAAGAVWRESRDSDSPVAPM